MSNNRKYIECLKLGWQRQQDILKNQHQDSLERMETSKQYLAFVSRNKNIIQDNLERFLYERNELKNHILTSIANVPPNKIEIWTVIFASLYREIFETLDKRIAMLKGLLFKIRIFEAEQNGEKVQHRITASDVKQVIKIEDLCSKYNIQIKRNGGMCPIHKDSNPSFRIYPKTNSWFCFGCGKGGSVIDLVMELENIDFKQAIQFLAKTL